MLERALLLSARLGPTARSWRLMTQQLLELERWQRPQDRQGHHHHHHPRAMSADATAAAAAAAAASAAASTNLPWPPQQQKQQQQQQQRAASDGPVTSAAAPLDATMTTTTTATRRAAAAAAAAVPCAPPPPVHPLTGRRTRAAVALSGGVDSAVAALLARERFGRENVLCVWARTWDAGDEEGSGAGGAATAPACYGGVGSCSPSSTSLASSSAAPPVSSSSSSPQTQAQTQSLPVTPSACEAEADLRSAQRVASALGLPLVEADLRAAYWNGVFDGFLAEAGGGSATPNPDLGCNSAVKFGALLEFARAEMRRRRFSRRGEGGEEAGGGGGDGEDDDDDFVLVTGHYARVGVAVAGGGGRCLSDEGEEGPPLPPHPLGGGGGGRTSSSSPSSPSSARLLRGLDRRKDQSYFLSSLSAEQLARSWFPIGEAPSKAAVRAAARRAAAAAQGGGAAGGGGGQGNSGEALSAAAARRSSAGICFVGRRRRFAEFLEGYLEPVPGRFVCCETGADLGACANLLAVTHGQRASLEGGAMARGTGGSIRGSNSGGGNGDNSGDNKSRNPRWYVVAKDMQRRVAHVAAGRNHPALRSRAVLLEAPRWVAGGGGSGGNGGGGGDHAPLLPFPPGALLQFKARYRQEATGWCRVRLASAEEAAERAGGGGGAGGAGGGASFRASRFFQRRRLLSSSPPPPLPPLRLLLVAELTEPAHAPTPGQAFVLYHGDECLGNATIAAPGRTVFEEEEQEE